MGFTSRNRQLGLLKLFCGTLLLLAQAEVLQGRRMQGGPDLWGEGGMMMREVVHVRRLQSSPYCVAASGADESKLQDALDWACGPAENNKGGGVDCSAILQTGACYNPNTLQAHASYAFNYYYVKQNGASGSCDFGGLASTTNTDPSSGSCVYPSLGSGVASSPPFSNSTTPFSSNSTGFTSPTTTGSSSAAMGLQFSWLDLCWSLLVVNVVVLCTSQF